MRRQTQTQRWYRSSGEGIGQRRLRSAEAKLRASLNNDRTGRTRLGGHVEDVVGNIHTGT
jgi:hypothetical protein